MPKKKEQIIKTKGEKINLSKPEVYDFQENLEFVGKYERTEDENIIFSNAEGEFIIPTTKGLLSALCKNVNGREAKDQKFTWYITLKAEKDGVNQYEIEVE